MSITRSVTTFPLQLKMILETSWVLKGLQEILTNFFFNDTTHENQNTFKI